MNPDLTLEPTATRASLPNHDYQVGISNTLKISIGVLRPPLGNLWVALGIHTSRREGKETLDRKNGAAMKL